MNALLWPWHYWVAHWHAMMNAGPNTHISAAGWWVIGVVSLVLFVAYGLAKGIAHES